MTITALWELLTSPIGKWLIGLLSVAMLVWGIHHDGFKEGIAKLDAYKTEQANLAAKQLAANKLKELADRKRQEENDLAHKEVVKILAADAVDAADKLREQSRTSILPKRSTTAGSAETATFNVDKFNSGMAEADDYLSRNGLEIARRGQEAIGSLNLALTWALHK